MNWEVCPMTHTLHSVPYVSCFVAVLIAGAVFPKLSDIRCEPKSFLAQICTRHVGLPRVLRKQV